MAIDDSVAWGIDLSAMVAAPLGRHDEGVDIARRGLELHPGNADVRGFLAYALMHAGIYREAEEHIRAAMSLNPFPPWWYRNGLARILIYLGEFDEALTIVDDLLGTVTATGFPGLPDSVEVTGYHEDPNGVVLLSFDTTVELPGSPSPITVRPGDVVRLEGGSYAIEFDADSFGVPDGAIADAVGRAGTSLLISFDVSVPVASGGVAVDEDLVTPDGAGVETFLDTSSFGAPEALDLDAVHYVEANGHLLLSFDGSGSILGVSFDDEDVLDLDPFLGTWDLPYDGSAEHAGWSPGDLDALHTLLDADEDGLADDVDNCPGVPNGAAEPLGSPTWGNQAASAQYPGVGCACLCGDPNRDCVINVGDAPEAQRAGLVPPLPPLSPLFDLDFCDLNSDGLCNVGDSPEMQRAGLFPSLPPLSPNFDVTGCIGYLGQ